MRRRLDTVRCNLARGLVALVVLGAEAAGAAGAKPGSYCPIPEPGQRPTCLDGAEERYSAFYQGLESGKMDDAAADRIEADLAAGGEAARTYEALSSLAYGYYVLSKRVAASPKSDPELVARLERWNTALASAWREAPPETGLQSAVREAAEDIRHRAAPVELACRDAAGHPATCTSTDAVLREMDARDQSGLRGQLGRLFERLLGDGGGS